MKAYLQERERLLLLGVSFIVFLNGYFLVLAGNRLYLDDLIYLDALMIAAGLVLLKRDMDRWRQEQKKMQEQRLSREADEALIRDLQSQLSASADYAAKWAHEVKLPLASLKLMNGRNQDESLRESMEDCLERIQQLLNTMLMSSKLKNLENDVEIRRVSLSEAVQKALKNQSYFLIREHFTIHMELRECLVYSDERWLVYILDQLIGNAVKYHRENPSLTFGVETKERGTVRFWMEDNGIGIEDSELPYIFDKGFIGSNLRDGDYRSTGMGLYFVKKTCKRLGVGVTAESKVGEGTRFTFTFQDIACHFLQEC